jgi:hypothetical protein
MRWRSPACTLPIGLAATVLAAVTGAHAQPPSPEAPGSSPSSRSTSVRLRYERDLAASGCPNEAALRDAVSARLGYEPFSEKASRTVRAHVGRKDGAFHGTVELYGANGTLEGERRLHSESDRCDELARSLALALSIAIDPLAARLDETERPRGEATHGEAEAGAPGEAPARPTVNAEASAPSNTAEPVPSTARSEADGRSPHTSEPQPAPTPNTNPAVTPRPEPRPTVSAGLGVLASLGALPEPTPAISAWTQLSFGAFSLGIEGRFDVPAKSRVRRNVQVEASLLQVSVQPCGHYGALFGCGVVSAGALRASASGVDAAEDRTSAYVAAGARVGAQHTFENWLVLRARGELLGTFARTSLLIGDEVVWKSPAVAGSVGVDLGVRLR